MSFRFMMTRRDIQFNLKKKKKIEVTLKISKLLNIHEKLIRYVLPPLKPRDFCVEQFFIGCIIRKLRESLCTCKINISFAISQMKLDGISVHQINKVRNFH